MSLAAASERCTSPAAGLGQLERAHSDDYQREVPFRRVARQLVAWDSPLRPLVASIVPEVASSQRSFTRRVPAAAPTRKTSLVLPR
jgi:hypothetical protein